MGNTQDVDMVLSMYPGQRYELEYKYTTWDDSSQRYSPASICSHWLTPSTPMSRLTSMVSKASWILAMLYLGENPWISYRFAHPYERIIPPLPSTPQSSLNLSSITIAKPIWYSLKYAGRGLMFMLYRELLSSEDGRLFVVVSLGLKFLCTSDLVTLKNRLCQYLDYSEWRNLKICTMTASEKASLSSLRSVFLPPRHKSSTRNRHVIFVALLISSNQD